MTSGPTCTVLHATSNAWAMLITKCNRVRQTCSRDVTFTSLFLPLPVPFFSPITSFQLSPPWITPFLLWMMADGKHTKACSNAVKMIVHFHDSSVLDMCCRTEKLPPVRFFWMPPNKTGILHRSISSTNDTCWSWSTTAANLHKEFLQCDLVTLNFFKCVSL